MAIDRAITRGRLYFPRQRRGRPPGHPLAYPLDELLFQHRLAREGGLEVHACGVVTGGRLALFCGQSGAGKSTLARLWRRHRPDAPILSDDRIACGSHGSRLPRLRHALARGRGLRLSARARLGAVFFLRQSPRSRARRLTPPECAARLFTRSFPPPWDRRGVGRVLAACARIARETPAYELAFRPDETAVEAALAVLRPTRP